MKKEGYLNPRSSMGGPLEAIAFPFSMLARIIGGSDPRWQEMEDPHTTYSHINRFTVFI